MKIAVAGTGYVGLSMATLLAQHHEVVAVDVIPEKVEKINNRISPIQDDYIEKYLAEKKPLDYLQFQRIGYFNVDKDSTPEHLIFNRTVSLKDTWSKIKGK
mgnify:CR=1 FL=1